MNYSHSKKFNLSLSRKRKRQSEDGNANGSKKRDLSNFNHCETNLQQKFNQQKLSATSNKKSKFSILQMLQKPQQRVSCPVCGTRIAFSEINQHLDNECPGLDTQSQLDSQLHYKKSCLCEKMDSVGTNVKIEVLQIKEGKREHFKDSEVHCEHFLEKKCCLDSFTVSCNNSCISETIANKSFEVTDNVEERQLKKSRNKCTSKKKLVKKMNGYETCKEYHMKENEENSCGSSDDNKISYREDVTQSHRNEMNSEEGMVPLVRNKNHCHHEMYDSKIIITSNTSLESVDKVINRIDNKIEYNDKPELEEVSKDEEKAIEPYYLANFLLVLKTVLSNEDEAKLFNEQDKKVLDSFSNLNAEAKKLYIRLFQRKSGWFKCSKLEYPKISTDLKPLLKILIEKDFLKDEKELTDLKDVLHLIPAPELRTLAKSLHILPSSSRIGQNKQNIVNAFLQHSNKQLSLFGDSGRHILKRAKSVLGPCVYVSQEARDVFCRVILLFTMNMIPEDDDNGQAQQLSTLFLVNVGRLSYPSYTIDKPTPVFSCRDDLMAYAEAYQSKHDMFLALDAGDLEQAYSFYPKAKAKFEQILTELGAKKQKGSSVMCNWLSLPLHLRCFTAEWVHTKMCYYGVEILQKMRRYEEAVLQLQSLLEQDVLCVDSRGCWWDRLALNIQQHLRQPQKAYEAIRNALLDPYVRSGRRLALVQRAKRLLSSTGYSKYKDQVEDITDSLLKEPNPPNTVTITGKRSAQLGVFISHDIDQKGEIIQDTLTYCSVEEYTLAHFRKQGYNQGLHSEGSVFTTLYGLFMWDIIFAGGVPNVFRGPFQSAPLDIFLDCFYEKREALIQERLTCIRMASVQELQQMLSNSWHTHEGEICTGVHWDLFTGPDQVKELVACFGGQLLASVFEVFARDLRHTRSGLPDLVVWNSTSLDFRIVEVKGPGDRLSTKQQLWLDRLTRFGACAEVCYVTAVGAKKLRRLEKE